MEKRKKRESKFFRNVGIVLVSLLIIACVKVALIYDELQELEKDVEKEKITIEQRLDRMIKKMERRAK